MNPKEKARLLRSLLFVPGHREKYLESAARSDADVLILDVEDSVPLSEKPAARELIKRKIKSGLFANREIIIRINSRENNLVDEDLGATIWSGVSGIMPAKPQNEEDIQFWLKITNTTLKDILIEKQGKEILGYCWTQMLSLKNHGSNQKKGRIHMIGVPEKYRGKGIGKKLLLAGLAYLKEKGAEVVDLTSDEENTPAYTLYKSLGFSPISRNVWYEKNI